MSDNRTSLTPIIVGCVIALLGILTGLYVADNAREQLALAQTGSQADEIAPDQQMMDLPAMPEAEMEMPELPPLDPAVMEVPPVREEIEETQEEAYAEAEKEGWIFHRRNARRRGDPGDPECRHNGFRA